MSLGEHTPLAIELRYFESHRASWVSTHPQQYVAIRGTEVLGFYGDFESALEGALQRCKMGEFLIKQVLEQEPIFAIF